MQQETKRQRKCLMIETNESTGAVEGIKEMPQYSPEEEDFASIWNLHLWKSGGLTPSDYAIPPSDALEKEEAALVDTFTDVKASATGTATTNSWLKKPTTREIALESLQKALSEFSKLLNLTSLINEQQSLTLSTCHRQTTLPKRGASLPSTQVLSLRRQYFKSAQDFISRALVESEEATGMRQKFFAGVLALKEYWRLIKLSPTQAAHLLGMLDEYTPSNRKLRNGIAVDCSYATAMGESSSMYSHLVPLLHGPNGPMLSRRDEENIPLTVMLSIRKKKHLQNGVVMDGSLSAEEDVVKVYAWNPSTLDSLPKPQGYEDIHRYLQRRQHEAFCVGLFSHIHKETIEVNDRWIASFNDLDHCISSSSDTSVPRDVKHQPVNLCPSSFMQGLVKRCGDLPIEVTLLERNEIVLSLPWDDTLSSQHPYDPLELVIKLVPPDLGMSNHSGDSEYHSGMNITTTDDIRNSIKAEWSEVLHNALVATQLLYLRFIQSPPVSRQSDSLTTKMSLKESLRSLPLKLPVGSSQQRSKEQSIIFQLLSKITKSLG